MDTDMIAIGSFGYFNDLDSPDTMILIGTWGYIYELGQPGGEIVYLSSSLKTSNSMLSSLKISETRLSSVAY